ncbi:uncharacterized protein N7473_008456 [Penicillium subrubescens]|uniref:Myb-like DNA-binding domain-containing protein n=1 Tax=Penicillium subrubescens TaxID=1316194 RepID=A0A1Q5TET7_9EURO|nr:uncharacterized protein N7473_008456 [Penicillium subrubescens]KAJ5892228.1 hypothetical protein N7473_008456 [Penicillium subrubescens]OKO98702.1 hypothetical protein PENSUB_8953 [Penicillium subrubescens]
MAPKAAAKAAPGSDSASTTEQQDNAIMAMCLRKIDPHTHKIDAAAVAEALGYTNPKSLGNRWSAMKKKYEDIRVEMSYPPRAGGPTSPKAPASPKVSPDKVQKKRGRKPKAAKASEPKAEDDETKAEEAKIEDLKVDDDKVSENEV